MKELKIALVQMNCEKGRIQENLKRIQYFAGQCVRSGAEIVCFPEMSITGYINPLRYPESVLNLSDPAIGQFARLSKDSDAVLIAGFAQRNPSGRPFITQIAVQGGKILCVYRKINVAEDESGLFACGKEISVFRLSGIQIGLAVCADADKESIFAAYAKAGARLVFECASPGLYGDQETRSWLSGYNWWKENCAEKLGGYAKKHHLYIAVSTHSGRTVDEDFPGGGYVFSPEGGLIAETADWRESVLTASIPVP